MLNGDEIDTVIGFNTETAQWLFIYYFHFTNLGGS